MAFAQDGERLIGQPAKRQGVTNPEYTFFAIKRLIGRRYDDPMTQKDMGMVPYKIVKADNGDAWVAGREGKNFARGNLRLHPAEDEGNRRSLSRREGHPGGHHGSRLFQRCAAPGDQGRRQIAGLEVLRIINEPTAAALAYGMDKKGTGDHRGL